jgi:hypothetical protein
MDLIVILLLGISSLMLLVGIWAWVAYRKLYGHYFNIWIILFIFFVPGHAQDAVYDEEDVPYTLVEVPEEDIAILEDQPLVEAPDDEDPAIISLPEKPMVFPEEMPRAATTISIGVYGYMGEFTEMKFNQTAWDLEFYKLMNLTNLSF